MDRDDIVRSYPYDQAHESSDKVIKITMDSDGDIFCNGDKRFVDSIPDWVQDRMALFDLAVPTGVLDKCYIENVGVLETEQFGETQRREYYLLVPK